MKIDELSDSQLKTLRDWGKTKSYGVILNLMRSVKVSDATLLRKELGDSKSEWDAVKVGMRRSFIGEGHEEVLDLPKRAERILVSKEAHKLKEENLKERTIPRMSKAAPIIVVKPKQ